MTILKTDINKYVEGIKNFSALSSPRDADGVPISGGDSLLGVLTGETSDGLGDNLIELREECWRNYWSSPFVRTSIDDTVSALVGDGFGVASSVPEINEVIKKTTVDFRNTLYKRWRQYMTHRKVSGELYLCLSCHDDEDFIEVDFVSPERIDGVDSSGSGIIFHPSKTHMPVVYNVCMQNPNKNESVQDTYEQIPSINVAYAPSLLETVKDEIGFRPDLMQNSRSSAKRFKATGGYRRFIIEAEGSTICRRNTSYLRSVLVWANLYTLLKVIEIDYKRSLANYAWIAAPEDMKAWELWASLTDDQKAETGLMLPKKPGSTLIAPPGWKITVQNPSLTQISDSDTDILEMLIGGLNVPSDIATGSSKGTFASVKESRGPYGDRIKHEQSELKKFLLYDFWKPLFRLYSKLYKFPEQFPQRVAVAFNKKQEPVFKKIMFDPEELIDISFPIFSSGDYDGQVKAQLGSKHAGLNRNLGVSLATTAEKLGVANYHKERLRSATEADMYPNLVTAEDDESMQEEILEPSTKEKLPVKKDNNDK